MNVLGSISRSCYSTWRDHEKKKSYCQALPLNLTPGQQRQRQSLSVKQLRDRVGKLADHQQSPSFLGLHGSSFVVSFPPSSLVFIPIRSVIYTKPILGLAYHVVGFERVFLCFRIRKAKTGGTVSNGVNGERGLDGMRMSAWWDSSFATMISDQPRLSTSHMYRPEKEGTRLGLAAPDAVTIMTQSSIHPWQHS
jgi:hypothetical protein